MNKVPEVILFFWIIKIMATTVGETGADFLIFNLDFGLTVTSIIMMVLLAACLFGQIMTKKYIPWVYWLTVVMISIVGTLITDNLTDNFDVPLTLSTTIFAIILIITFAIWYVSEKTLSIHTIYTPKREIFYWAAILFTFALGTAAGDLLAEDFQLGYMTSGVIFGALIAIITAAYFLLGMNAVLAFWLAYILTRPFGASVGDYLSQPYANGGLGLGTIATSGVFLCVIAGLVMYLSMGERRGNI